MSKRVAHTIFTTLAAAFALVIGTGAARATELTVSAAVSLKPALEELAKSYQTETKDKLTFNFGASGALQQQIENGAPVDVFLSAASKQMDALAAKALLLEGTRRELLRNELVLVVPNGAKGIESFEDLKRDTVKRIAVGEPKAVPAGQYAHEVFTTLKLADALASKLIPAGNVRQVLTYVEGKDVDAGVVYASDARDSAKVTVVAKADPAWHSPIVYPVAVLRTSKHAAEATRFATWLGSKAAIQIFVKHGFQAGKDAS
jgi:molybdate transport system substrate-binding protein